MVKKIYNYYDMINLNYSDSIYKKLRVSTKNKKEVLRFSNYLNMNSFDILNKLYNKEYKFDKYRIFLINEPKYRLVMAEKFEDKIVNHLFTEYVLKPSLEPSLIYTNVATREDKGSKVAYKYFEKYVNTIRLTSDEVYVLKIDISKYFYNIDHEVLIKELSKKIKDDDTINFIKYILSTTDEDYVNEEIKRVIGLEKERIDSLNISLKEKEIKYSELDKIPMYQKGKGLPIGNQSSQMLAIYYLNSLDHFIKEKLKCKFYLRYMDDLFILSSDKTELKNKFISITNRLKYYKLRANAKSNIFKLSDGITVLGYRYKIIKGRLKILYKKDTLKRIKRRLKFYKEYEHDFYLRSKASYNGYLKKCNTNFYREIMEKI